MKIIILSLISILALTGCQEFESLDIKLKDNKIEFTNNEISKHCINGVYIISFGVEYKNETQSINAWSIARALDSNPTGKIYELPLKYGAILNGVETRSEAIKMKTGTYNYGGSLACLSSSGDESISIIGSFSLNVDNDVLSLK